MKNKELLQKLQQSGGFVANTHVEMTGSDHCDTYLNKDLLLSDPNSLKAIAEAMEELINEHVDVVCGPPLGGLMLAQAVVLNSLDTKREYKLAITEKSNARIRLKRGQADVVRGKRVLIVDDVVKTGQTLQHTICAVEGSGGVVAQCIILANWRSIDLAQTEVQTLELLARPEIYSPDACLICKRGIKLSLGKRM